jgi:hypothetical protein
MIRAYYTLKWVRFAAFIGQLAIGQRTAYTSQLPLPKTLGEIS